MSTPSRWMGNTAYAVGDVVQSFTDTGTGFYFRCVAAGTTGSVEPFWPTVINNTVLDGTVTWAAVSIVAGDFQLPNPSAIIELFELQLRQDVHGTSEVYRFHSGTNAVDSRDIIWRSYRYMAMPIEADGFEYSGQGQLPRPKIRVSNVLGTITSLLLSLPNGLEGARVTRIRTLAKYLDAANFPSTNEFILHEDLDKFLLEDGDRLLLEPVSASEDTSAEWPREIFFIDRKTVENRNLVEFELVSSLDLAGIKIPKRQCISNICQWRYRSSECGYTGTSYWNADDVAVASPEQDVCGKRLSSCRLRFGANSELPFGSFPGIGSVSS